MEIFLMPETWIALLTLTFLEIVLGVDNVIFISIVANKLPKDEQKKARNTGLALALVFRVALLISLTWLLQHLINPIFTIYGMGFSIREIILLLGGLFLLAKSTSEIHHKMAEGDHEETATAFKNFRRVVLQIVIIDSILTAVGLVDADKVIIMILAVVISMFVMMAFSGKIAGFISQNPTIEILALSFLILIGFMLMLEGVHIEVPKGYIYFAVFFSLVVEMVNLKLRSKKISAKH